MTTCASVAIPSDSPPMGHIVVSKLVCAAKCFWIRKSPFVVRQHIDGCARPCDFGRLPELIMLSHMLAPLLCLPFTWCLVPAASIDDEQAAGHLKLCDTYIEGLLA
eukprot:1754071-Amphidinium_carterae.1